MWQDFILASVLMAVAIGSDVAIVTVMQKNNLKQKKQQQLWLLGVSVSHSVLPALGYALTLTSLALLPVLTPIVGLIAFIFIGYFLWQELTEDDVNLSVGKQLVVNFALILAVSWDALWSGPAKSAQVIGWEPWLILLSFFVVGLFVWCLAKASLMLAQRVTVKSGKLQQPLLYVGRWLQYTLLAYFAFLAISQYTFNIVISNLNLLSFAGFFIAICLLIKQMKFERKMLFLRE